MRWGAGKSGVALRGAGARVDKGSTRAGRAFGTEPLKWDTLPRTATLPTTKMAARRSKVMTVDRGLEGGG